MHLKNSCVLKNHSLTEHPWVFCGGRRLRMSAGHSRRRPPLYHLLLPLTSYLLCFTPSPCTSAHLEPPRTLLKVWETTERALRGYDMSPPAAVTVPQLPSCSNLQVSHHPHPQPQKECHFLPSSQDSSRSCSKNMHLIPWSLHHACLLWNPELGLQEVLSID